jgi:hypothetical protein
MPQGLFVQSAAVLFETMPSLEQVQAALSEFEGARTFEGREGAGWLGGFPGVLVDFRPEVNGKVAVDLIDRPWPDHMGDPQSDPDLFNAWSMGSFGPFVFPGNLSRAAEQSVVWADGAMHAVGHHTGFLRLRVSYVFGLDPEDEDATVLPDDHDPIAELDFLIRLSMALLQLPGALAYFNPNGEVIMPGEEMADSLLHAAGVKLPPLDLYGHVRLVRLHDEDGWLLMDTVGLEQLGIDDHEIAFPPGAIEADAGAAFLRNLSMYLLHNGPVMEEGHTVEGPGGKWIAFDPGESIFAPPRPVLRWFPTFTDPPPVALTTREEPASENLDS